MSNGKRINTCSIISSYNYLNLASWIMPFIMTAFKLHDLVFWALNSVDIIKADLL